MTEEPEPDPEMRTYWEALGRFISTFSMVENMLLATLWQLSSLPIEIGQALLSDVRVDKAISLARRLCDVNNIEPERKMHLNLALAQLAMINTARNRIVHHGIQSHEDSFKVSNRLRAHTKDKIQEIRMSPVILGKMTADLLRISAHLLRVRLTLPDDVIRQMTEKQLARPWQFALEQHVIRS